MFLTALALHAAVQAERWVDVGGSEGPHREYLDTQSIKRTGEKVTLWTRRDLVQGQDTVWNELEFDCSKRTDTIVAYIRDDRGTISHNDVRPHRGPAPIRPKSARERIFKLVCR